MPVRRYKEGFERLGMVAFVVFAAIFGIIHYTAAPYQEPDKLTARGRAIETEVRGECGKPENAVFAYLCRQRVMARYRWQHDREQAPIGIIGIVVVVAGVVCFLTFRWVRDGFRAK